MAPCPKIGWIDGRHGSARIAFGVLVESSLDRPLVTTLGGHTMSTEDEAFETGYEAYWEGVDPDDNPHKAGTNEHASWDEGWSQAELEDDEEIP